jgi:hypothetical protein
MLMLRQAECSALLDPGQGKVRNEAGHSESVRQPVSDGRLDDLGREAGKRQRSAPRNALRDSSHRCHRDG